MHDLQKILEENSKYSDYDMLVRDIEVYIAKQYIFNILETGEDSVRIFPKDGSHFIDLSSNHGIEEKLFVIFQRLYDFGLHHYVEAINFYGGNVSFQIKEMYNRNDIKKIFEEIFKNGIIVCGDHITYDFKYK
jgi:hypothetical protein